MASTAANLAHSTHIHRAVKLCIQKTSINGRANIEITLHCFRFVFTFFPSLLAESTTDERVQRRSTVRLGVRLIHKICPESNKASALETATENNSYSVSDSGGLGPKSPPIAVDPPSNSSSTITNPTTPTSMANSAINPPAASASSGGGGGSNNSTIPRALRLRLSPKSLKLSSLHRHSSSVDSTNGGIRTYGEHGLIELTDVNKVS